MKNLFNDISQEERNRILEMHSGKKNVISEQVPQPVPQAGVKKTAPQVGGLNYKVLADTLDKSMRGVGTNLPLLQSVINKIKTPQDWQKLNDTFGTRDGQNLEQWLKGELKIDYNQIMSNLIHRGIISF